MRKYFVLVVPAALALALVLGQMRTRANAPIAVGVLHSLTGTMAVSEKPVVDGTLLAIEEINARGGINGRLLRAVVADGASDDATFARQAERLIDQDHVSVIFGCWTSASRKTVKPILEKYNSLLFYPVQYEGMETSPNIVYTGAAPNQQILPAVKWFFHNVGSRFFLIGSDYIFPHCANETIKDYLRFAGGRVVGEMYLPFPSHALKSAVSAIVKARPDVILSTINGDTNIDFFEALHAAGVSPQKMPVVSFSMGEEELRWVNPLDVAGNYAAWSYFQSLQDPDNQRFVQRFKARYGSKCVTDDPIEAGYFGVYMWAGAVAAARSEGVNEVREALRYRSYAAPEGTVYVDAENQHTWKRIRIGRIRADGQFEVMWASEELIHPVPFPVTRTEAQWNELLNSLYVKWGGHWANAENRARAEGRLAR